MLGETPEMTVMMRMEQIRAEVEQERLVRIALQTRKHPLSGILLGGEMKRRTTNLPGLLLRWWNALTQHRPVTTQPIASQGTSTCT
jgi:hypothetical protein